jgi:hypothetical protein
MRPKVIFIVAASCGILSCTTSADSGRSNADVSGVYVREYAFEVSNPETGKKVGMRQVRDSIFIERAENGYQVSNRKWRMNDYDQEGWVSMAHAEDKPLPTFFASYDKQSESLLPEKTGYAQPIFIDDENGTIFKDGSRELAYNRID